MKPLPIGPHPFFIIAPSFLSQTPVCGLHGKECHGVIKKRKEKKRREMKRTGYYFHKANTK